MASNATLHDAPKPPAAATALAARVLHLPITTDAEAFGRVAHESDRVLVRLGEPTAEARRALGPFVVAGVEAELERLGAAPSGWAASDPLEEIIRDQLYRARLLGSFGVAVSFASLSALADAGGRLSTEDSETLHRLLAVAEREPLQLYLPRPSAELLIAGAPQPLSSWLPPRLEPGQVATIEYDPTGDAEPASAPAPSARACLLPPLLEAFFDPPPPPADEAPPLPGEANGGEANGGEANGGIANAVEPERTAASGVVPADRGAEVAPGAAIRPGAAEPGRSEQSTPHPAPEPETLAEPLAARPLAITPVELHAAGPTPVAVAAAPRAFAVAPRAASWPSPASADAASSSPAPGCVSPASADAASSSPAPSSPAPGCVSPASADAASSSPAPRGIAAPSRSAGSPVPRSLSPRSLTPRSLAPSSPASSSPASSSPASTDPAPSPPPPIVAERTEAERAERCLAWAAQLDGMSGPKAHGSVEKAFIGAYLPLCRELALGGAPGPAREARDRWAEGFAQGYASAFRQLGGGTRRPRMVRDVVELGARWLGQQHARQCQLLLITEMRFDLGQRLNEEIERRLAGKAMCVEQCVLWTALPSNAEAQQLGDARGRRVRPDPAPAGPADEIESGYVGSRELFRLRQLSDELSRPGEGEARRLGQLAHTLADTIVPWMQRQPPETLIVLFGDHGFHWEATAAGTSAAQRGGALPEQVLVPASAWLLRERARPKTAPGVH